jgi:hypothetical protein
LSGGGAATAAASIADQASFLSQIQQDPSGEVGPSRKAHWEGAAKALQDRHLRPSFDSSVYLTVSLDSLTVAFASGAASNVADPAARLPVSKLRRLILVDLMTHDLFIDCLHIA